MRILLDECAPRRLKREQQNLAQARVAIVVLAAATNRLVDLMPLVLEVDDW